MNYDLDWSSPVYLVNFYMRNFIIKKIYNLIDFY